MGYTIAIAGKGGTGKTTLAAMLVRLLKEKDGGSILAVDADPNSNLGEALGLPVDQTIGKVLDRLAASPDKIPAGMTKDRFIEYQVQTIIQEADGFDLLTMGKPEGPGCYCYVNNVLRSVLEKITKNYKYIVIDNEAGLEHLSRRTTRRADLLILVSQANPVSFKAAKRIGELVTELDIKVEKKFLVVNCFQSLVKKEIIKDIGSGYLGNIPQDNKISKISYKGESIWKLSKESKAFKAMQKIFKGII